MNRKSEKYDEFKQDILDYVEKHAPEQIQWTADLCDQNSYSYNKQGTDKVARMVLDRLDGVFSSHRVIEQQEVGNHHILRNELHREAIYLVGHLDTVFPPDHTFQKCRLDGDLLKGPGTADMKGGLAVIVYALEALQAAGKLDTLSLALILNSDEEIGSATSRPLFEEERKSAAACLCAECAGADGEVVVSRNGKLGGRLDCFGEGRHVGAGTHEKTSAILELSHQVIELESLNGTLPGASLNVGRVEGGLGPSTVAERAFALCDVRWRDESHGEKLLAEIGRLTSKSFETGCRTEFSVLNSRPAMKQHEGTEALFSRITKAGRSLGLDIRPEHRRGTSDANFFGSIGVPTLDGLGPIGLKDHTPDEFIHVSSLKSRTALLALLLAGMAEA